MSQSELNRNLFIVLLLSVDQTWTLYHLMTRGSMGMSWTVLYSESEGNSLALAILYMHPGYLSIFLLFLVSYWYTAKNPGKDICSLKSLKSTKMNTVFLWWSWAVCGHWGSNTEPFLSEWNTPASDPPFEGISTRLKWEVYSGCDLSHPDNHEKISYQQG